ncbi:MAG: diaminopimelate decarboxylase [Candidatus Latescibacterota bacterium]|nr:MAG: diaminopimelate decarboxylase [Candidatus Latescibacterota bacterium]
MIVCKFGGACFQDVESLRRLHAIVEARRDETPLVVVSALADAPEQLVTLGRAESACTEKIAALAQRHLDLATEVAGCTAASRLEPWLTSLRAGPQSAATLADWVALGALLGSTLVAAALESRGLPSLWFDARHVVRTRGSDALRAAPDAASIQVLVHTLLRPELARPRVVVTQAGIGSNADGSTTLLGSDGSDRSAALLAAALGAQRIEIWRQLDAIAAAAPEDVPRARGSTEVVVRSASAKHGVPGAAAPHRLARLAHELVANGGTPFYVYELDRVEQQINALRAALRFPRTRIAYACKANFHPAIFRLMQKEGIGIDAVSPMEAERALTCGIPPHDILFTANNVATQALLQRHDRGVRINLGSLSDVERFVAQRSDTEVWLRLNPGVGEGHHVAVVTGGVDSKFGMLEEDLRSALAILSRRRVRVVGLHAHIGSGILDPAPLLESCRRLLALAADAPDVRLLNVGGGIGIPQRDSDPRFDLESFGTQLDELVRAAEQRLGRELEVWVEPGRFLVAHAGTLVATVTCRKESAGRVYVGLDTGMNHLVRPALYGSYHKIRNLSAPRAPVELVDVVGNICESTDVFAHARPLPSPQEGHLLAIEDVGAYGFAMASHYNLWPLPREVVVRDGVLVD